MNSKTTGTALVGAGILFTVIIIAWPILMGLSQTHGSMAEQLAAITADSSLYRLNFALAALIGPSISLLLVLLATEGGNRPSPLTILGLSILPCYLTLVSIAYTSQVILLPSLLLGGIDAELWYFNNPGSIPYFLNQLGYSFFALSALAIGWRFLERRGLPRAMGTILWLSGILSLVAFLGLALDNQVLNAATFISGILTVPLGVLAILWGLRLRRESDCHEASSC